MKIANTILIFMSILIINTTTINANTLNEYDAKKIYESSIKAIVEDNTEVPENSNILLFDKENKKIISIDKQLTDYYSEYKMIGYEEYNIPFIYQSGDILLEENLFPIKHKVYNYLEDIFKSGFSIPDKSPIERTEIEDIKSKKEINILFALLGTISLLCIISWVICLENKTIKK